MAKHGPKSDMISSWYGMFHYCGSCLVEKEPDATKQKRIGWNTVSNGTDSGCLLGCRIMYFHQIASHCAMSPVIFGFSCSKLCTLYINDHECLESGERLPSARKTPSPSAMNSSSHSSQNAKRLDFPQEYQTRLPVLTRKLQVGPGSDFLGFPIGRVSRHIQPLNCPREAE